MFSWQAFPFLPPSSRALRVSLAPKTPLSLPFQTPATQAKKAPVLRPYTQKPWPTLIYRQKVLFADH